MHGVLLQPVLPCEEAQKATRAMSPARRTGPSGIGQGILDAPGMAETPPIPRQLDMTDVVSISSIIKHISDQRNLDPSMVTERDMRVMNPAQIHAGLYVPEGERDIDVPDARGGLILPPDEFGFISTSPLRIGREVMRKYRAKHKTDLDKERVNTDAYLEAVTALETRLKRVDNLEGVIEEEQAFMDQIVRELGNARGTGFYAHYKAGDLRIKLASVETAIFRSLNVAATTLNWDKEKHERAQRTVVYQLYGKDVSRHKNWVGYAAMAGDYARQRKTVVHQSRGPIKVELKKYQTHLDEQK